MLQLSSKDLRKLALAPGLPAGDARDAAIASYATTAHDDANPADLLQQVQTIGNPAKRDDTLVSVLNGWLASNPQAARQ